MGTLQPRLVVGVAEAPHLASADSSNNPTATNDSATDAKSEEELSKRGLVGRVAGWLTSRP